MNRNSMSRSSRHILFRAMSVLGKNRHRSVRSRMRNGRGRRKMQPPPSSTTPARCCPCRPSAKLSSAMPSVLTRSGNASSNIPFPTVKRRTSSRRSRTKRDMEQPRSMDRLICGDVGFGKTEVAIRAAFKAVMEGKQVVLLAPTTVLAQQHFETFRQRMVDYPVRIEMLSRFRSPAEQRKVLQLLREGGIDVVIGTHRLISGDVVFKDLGLVVIDEEQRFGVLHKEKF